MGVVGEGGLCQGVPWPIVVGPGAGLADRKEGHRVVLLAGEAKTTVPTGAKGENLGQTIRGAMVAAPGWSVGGLEETRGPQLPLRRRAEVAGGTYRHCLSGTFLPGSTPDGSGRSLRSWRRCPTHG